MRRLLATGLLVASQAALAAGVVHEYQLDNGLKLIVKEDHRAPVVVSQVWYKVGSSYEHDGITGVSHVLEHMMFKGTDDHPPGEFSRIISENGGTENAFTSSDYTAYFQKLEKSRLPISFELEADRMRKLRLQDKEFRKEINVVMEERRLRTEDKPTAQTYEQFSAAAFTSSSVRIPTIGWMNDLENMQLADLQRWYERWYAPNNAVVVVVGDVVPEEVLKLAKNYFEPLKPEKIVPPKPRIEPEQQGSRRITVNAVAPGPVETDLFMHGKSTAQVEAITRLIPLGRLGQPDDIAGLVAFLAGLGAVFFELPGLSLAVSSMFVLLMVGLIMWETQNIVRGGETNYLMATVTLFVSVFNLFTSLLHILGFMGGDD